MKKLFILVLLLSGIMKVNALVISEVMSNPTGDDSGREWIELYNDTGSAIDLSNLTISIKGGNAVTTTNLQGGTSLPTGSYAIVGSTVSSQTKFLQDYPNYTGILFKSSISLVNTGTTSIDIKLGGATVNSLSSYTPAKEGSTLSLVSGSFVLSNPTPGADNQATPNDSSSSTSTSTTSSNQGAISQLSPPSADIILYMPFDKTVVAGAETEFNTSGMTRAGKEINDLNYLWSFGDGGQAMGTSTLYRYAYAGRYIAQVEGGNNYVKGVGRMNVRVVAPDISIANIGQGKYGEYVDINNPNNYDLDLSQWKLSFDGKAFPFPKNTLIGGNTTTRFSGIAMGFASTTVNSNSLVRILFPNMEEVTRYIQPEIKNDLTLNMSTSTSPMASTTNVTQPVMIYKKPINKIPKVVTATSTIKQEPVSKQLAMNKKDTRLVSFLKSLLGK